MKKSGKKNKARHWTEFIETPSIRKSRKRSERGLCIGCGHKPCRCKNPRTKRSPK